MTIVRVIPVCLYSAVFASIVRAQAAVEYAAKSASSAVSTSGTAEHLGVCPIDGALVHCVHRYYPEAFYIGLAVLCLVFWALLRPKNRI